MSWKAGIIVEAGAVGRAETAFCALDGPPPALVSFEIPPDGAFWSVEAVFEEQPDATALHAALRALLGPQTPRPGLEELGAVDWQAQALTHHQPVRAGRFFVHGSHHGCAAPGGGIAILIDASQAFGTGQHETTAGCLHAIDALAKGRRFLRPLDLGCGAGVLAIAMAKCWRTPVWASDIDPVAVAITAQNARRNAVPSLVRPLCAAGLDHRALAGAAPFDLIVANILAKPLRALAKKTARSLAADGFLVLSGLLASQEALVRSAYREQGLALMRRFALGPWTTLLLRAPG